MILKSYRQVIEDQESSALNEESISSLFWSYLGEMSVNEALTAILDDPIIQNSLTEGETEYLLSGVVLPAVIQDFAERFAALINEEENADVNQAFESWCEIENIPLELANLLASTINEATEAAAEEEDDDGVFKGEGDWAALSNEQRVAKVKAFLRMLAGAHNDSRQGLPFIKKLDVGKDIYGNEFGKNVKVYNREKNRHGKPPVDYSKDNDDNRGGLKQSNVPTIPVEGTALPNRPIVEQLAVVDRGNSVQRYARYMNRTLKNTSAGGYSSPAKAVQEAGRLRDEENKKFDYGKKDDREKDYTPLNETEFLDKKRKNN
jgi:hypothetical protein